MLESTGWWGGWRSLRQKAVDCDRLGPGCILGAVLTRDGPELAFFVANKAYPFVT